MIICSCNAFSDHQVWSTFAKATRRPRMRQIYDYLGGTPQCGRCARSIRTIVEKANPLLKRGPLHPLAIAVAEPPRNP